MLKETQTAFTQTIKTPQIFSRADLRKIVMKQIEDNGKIISRKEGEKWTSIDTREKETIKNFSLSERNLYINKIVDKIHDNADQIEIVRYFNFSLK